MIGEISIVHLVLCNSLLTSMKDKYLAVSRLANANTFPHTYNVQSYQTHNLYIMGQSHSTSSSTPTSTPTPTPEQQLCHSGAVDFYCKSKLAIRANGTNDTNNTIYPYPSGGGNEGPFIGVMVAMVMIFVIVSMLLAFGLWRIKKQNRVQKEKETFVVGEEV